MWSAQIFQALLAYREETKSFNIDATNPKTRNQYVLLSAQRIITIDEDENAIKNDKAGSVFWDASRQKVQAGHAEEMHKFLKAADKTAANVRVHYVVTGFVAINTNCVPTTLQQDGSDYSDSILGRLLHARNIAIWTNFDGVLSTDPRRVLNAFVLHGQLLALLLLLREKRHFKHMFKIGRVSSLMPQPGITQHLEERKPRRY